MTDKTSGKHYDFPQCREAIDVIEYVVSGDTLPGRASFCIGNALKYIIRAGRKDGESWRDDIAKAKNYLNRALTGEWERKE